MFFIVLFVPTASRVFLKATETFLILLNYCTPSYALPEAPGYFSVVLSQSS
jgi:hypothetical protein